MTKARTVHIFTIVCQIVTSFQQQRNTHIPGKTYFGDYSRASERLTEILKTYDKRVRPFDGGPTLNVSVQLGLVTLGPVDEKELTFQVDMFFKQWWGDPRLAIGGNKTFTLNMDPVDIFWVPDTFFANAKSATHHKVTTDNVRMKIEPTGNIYLSRRLTVEFSCKMKLNMYPMDTQKCTLFIESYSFTTRDLTYNWYGKDMSKSIKTVLKKVQLTDYVLESIDTGHVQHMYNSTGTPEHFSLLTVTFTIRRSFGYYMFHLYIPSSILVILTWATFWIPPDAVPARVTLVVTNFLSTLVLLQTSSSQLTRIDYRTSMEFFLSINITFVLAAMIEYCLVLNYGRCKGKKAKRREAIKRSGASKPLLNKSDRKQPENGFHLQNSFRKASLSTVWSGENGHPFSKVVHLLQPNDEVDDEEKKPKSRYTRQVHIIDRYSRILFPLTYTISLTIYFCYYFLHNQPDEPAV